MTIALLAETIRSGTELAEELGSLSSQYHVKSDQHEILQWESAIVSSKIEYLKSKSPVPENLRESCLLSSWASSLWDELPQLVQQVKDFHAAYDMLITD